MCRLDVGISDNMNVCSRPRWWEDGLGRRVEDSGKARIGGKKSLSPNCKEDFRVMEEEIKGLNEEVNLERI